MQSDESLLLDTHIWIRMHLFPELLRPKAREAIERAERSDRVFVSVISIWETAMLVRDGRLILVDGVDRWTKSALSLPGITMLPFSREIAVTSVNLPAPMHKDPSDRHIVASALVERLTLVSADKAVLKYAKLTGLPHIRG